MIRWINAAHAMGYVALSNSYDEDTFFREYNRKQKLLTPCEYKRLLASADPETMESFNEVIMWCLQDLQDFQEGLDETESLDLAQTCEDIKNNIMSLRSKISILFSYKEQPVPFVYVHFINLLISFYLPLMSYSLALFMDYKVKGASEIFGLLILLLSLIFILGLEQLGTKLCDPYGDDLEDIDVLSILELTLAKCKQAETSQNINAIPSSKLIEAVMRHPAPL